MSAELISAQTPAPVGVLADGTRPLPFSKERILTNWGEATAGPAGVNPGRGGDPAQRVNAGR
jgi:hypothetical protein